MKRILTTRPITTATPAVAAMFDTTISARTHTKKNAEQAEDSEDAKSTAIIGT